MSKFSFKVLMLLAAVVLSSVMAANTSVGTVGAEGITFGGNCSAPPGQFGSAHFGMYNAIVRTEIQDWDGTKLGYVEDFGFTVTPIPHPNWISDYISRQLPFDMQSVGNIIPSPMTHSYLFQPGLIPIQKNPPNPMIANPLIHQQMSVIKPDGFPAIPVTSPHLGQLEGAIGEGGSVAPGESIFRDVDLTDPNSFGDAAISALLNAVIPSNVNQARIWAGMGLGQYIRLDGGDQCEERNFTDPGRDSMASIPAYAFMNPNPFSPTPGGVFRIPSTPLQFLGVGHGSGGFSKYNPSQNGNYMLDCYGRGVDVGINLSSWSTAGWLGAVINGGLYIARVGSLVNSGVPVPGALPLPVMEKYYGMAYMFNLDTAPGRLTLPAEFQGRQYDITRHSIEHGLTALMRGHTLNGTKGVVTFVVKLRKPYQIKPTVTATDDRITPQGQTHRFEVELDKHGFDSGLGTLDIPTPGAPYKPNPSKKSDSQVGSTRAQNGSGQINTKIYRVKVRPGVAVKAIDRQNNPTDQLLKGYGEVCGEGNFIDNSLRNGLLDSSMQQPELNYSEDVIECVVDGDYTTHYDNRTDTGGVNVGNTFAPDPSNPASRIREYQVPAEEDPGTKVCYLVQMSRYTNDVKREGSKWWGATAQWRPANYNPAHNSTEETLTSWASCAIAGYKPSLQVRGGDMMVQGVIDTATNSKEFLASGDTPKEIRTYGSWAEYGALATGRIKGIGSGGLHRIGMPQGWLNIGYMTFSNNSTSTTPPTDMYGQYSDTLDTGSSRIERQFSSMTSSNVLSGDVKIEDLNGVYRVPSSINILSDREISTDTSVILLIEDGATVTVSGDIRIPSSYPSIDKISQVVIAPAADGAEYTLNIAHPVRVIDAWLINPSGTINTCYTGLPGSDAENIPRALGLCDNHLDVNGPVSAKDLLLRRVGGKDQGDATQIRQSRPAENFNLRPDAYIWATQYVSDGGKKYITTHSKDLPPRY